MKLFNNIFLKINLLVSVIIVFLPLSHNMIQKKETSGLKEKECKHKVCGKVHASRRLHEMTDEDLWIEASLVPPNPEHES